MYSGVSRISERVMGTIFVSFAHVQIVGRCGFERDVVRTYRKPALCSLVRSTSEA